MRVDKIYFDMDGVLADFNRGVAELCGIAPPLKQDEDPAYDDLMWAEVKKIYPDASYTIYRDENNKPYVEDSDFGLMCRTTVTIDGQTHEMWLPVMNGANKAMR